MIARTAGPAGRARILAEMNRRAVRESEPFKRGIELFNAGKFFDAHEAWEEIWLAEPEPEKTFLQGLIQLAAAFHHQARGNSKGLRSLLAAGLAKLGQFPEVHSGIALAKLRSDAEQWSARPNGKSEARPLKPPRIRLAEKSGRKKKRSG